MEAIIALLGGNLLLGAVQLYQARMNKKKNNAETDDIFVGTAKEIIVLLREESVRKDTRIAELEATVLRLEARIDHLEGMQ